MTFYEWAHADPLKQALFTTAEFMVLGSLAALGVWATVRITLWLMR